MLVDYDRCVNVENEDKNFIKLIEYCKNEQAKGKPTFLVTSNPDFDIFVLKHNDNYKNQDKLSFIKTNYNYGTIEDFKNDIDIFSKFNPNLDEYLKLSVSFRPEEYIITNKYNFDAHKYSFKNMNILYNRDNVIYKISNINDLLKLL